MQYKEHTEGLLMAMLSEDDPSWGAFKYVREHDLWDWERAVKIIKSQPLTQILYWEHHRKDKREESTVNLYPMLAASIVRPTFRGKPCL